MDDRRGDDVGLEGMVSVDDELDLARRPALDLLV
jgi:hypothetical protein